MKNLATLLVTLFAFVVTSAAGAASIRLREGVDYVRISPVQTQQVPGIEVIEFFSYGCPHCNQFEGTVGKWRATLRKDVTFRRVPISFGNTQWAALAKLYLALEVSGDLSRVDSDVFAAIHVKKLPLTNEKRIGDWIAMRVTDPKKFNEIYQSFGIEAMAKRAEQTGAAFGIAGVPSIGVAGRYLVLAKEAIDYTELLRITDRVIAMARQVQAGP